MIDPATLHDLEILSSATVGGATLLTLVDRTRTRAGSDQLRRRLAAPERSADRIMALQAAHRHLATRAREYQAHLTQSEADAVERYLGSTWQPPAAGWWLTRLVQGVWLRARYREYWRQLVDASLRVGALLQSARALARLLEESGQSELVDLASRLNRLLATEDAREIARFGGRDHLTALVGFDRQARGRGKQLLASLVELVGTVEAMWSLAVVAAERSWSYPTIGPGFRVCGLYHPLLKGRPVPNSLELPAEIRVCFLTGPNMAGKSTFLKAVAIAVLLAQIGCAVPAASMEFSPVETIFSSVQIRDNLAAGESFYLAEVRRIKALAAILHARGSALAVIDEPFRGTNVHDAAEATLAVMTRVTNLVGALVFVASHVGEVANQVEGDGRIRLLHFAAHLDAEVPRFDYVLREGVSLQRLGMTLLKNEGVLELLSADRDPPAN